MATAYQEAVAQAIVSEERLHTAVLLERIERDLTHDLEALFREQGRAFVDAYRRDHRLVQLFEAVPTERSWVSAYDYASERTRGRFQRRLGAAVRAALQLGGAFAVASVGFDPNLSFSLANPRAVDYLDEHGAELVRHIDDTTRERVRDTVAGGVEEGASHEAIARRVKALYAGFAVPKPQQHIRNRAHLIAVTEMGNAYSFGNMQVARELEEAGLDLEKSWLDLEDDRVDPVCLENSESGWIPLQQPYPSGHMSPLAHPACRCDQLYRLRRMTLEEATTHIRAHVRQLKSGKLVVVRGHNREFEPGNEPPPVYAPGVVGEVPKPYNILDRAKHWWELKWTGESTFDDALWYDTKHPGILSQPGEPSYLRGQRIDMLRDWTKAYRASELVSKTGILAVPIPEDVADVRVKWYDPATQSGPDVGLRGYAASNLGFQIPPGVMPHDTPPLIIAYRGSGGNQMAAGMGMGGLESPDLEFTIAHELGHLAGTKIRGGPVGGWGQASHKDEEIVANLYAERLLGRLRKDQKESWGGNITAGVRTPAEATQFTKYGATTFMVKPWHLASVEALRVGKEQPKFQTFWTRENMPLVEAATAPGKAMLEVWVCEEGIAVTPNTTMPLLQEGRVKTYTRKSRTTGQPHAVREHTRKDRPKRASNDRDPVGKGTCYENANYYITDYYQPGDVLVHGRPHLSVDAKDSDGKVHPAGTEFGHAWIERGDMVIDPSRDLKKPVEMKKAVYYALGGIDASKNVVYTRQQAFERMMQSMHHGPWVDPIANQDIPGPKLEKANVEEAISYAVKHNKGRPMGSTPWNEAQIRSAMQDAEAALTAEPDTFIKHDHEPARVKMRDALVKQQYGKGAKPERGQRPQAFVYVGPPGAGKSHLQMADMQRMGIEPVLIDADEFKAMLPEWRGGLGANATHEESSFMKGKLLEMAIAGRDHIAMPIVGKTYEGLYEQVSQLERLGYDVHINLVDASPQTSLNRTLNRFVETGRYIKPVYTYSQVDSKPRHNYFRLLKEPDLDFASMRAFNVDTGKMVPIESEE